MDDKVFARSGSKLVGPFKSSSAAIEAVESAPYYWQHYDVLTVEEPRKVPEKITVEVYVDDLEKVTALLGALPAGWDASLGGDAGWDASLGGDERRDHQYGTYARFAAKVNQGSEFYRKASQKAATMVAPIFNTKSHRKEVG